MAQFTTTYAGLVSLLQTYVEDTSTEYASAVQGCINRAEERILRDLDLAIWNITTSSRILSWAAIHLCGLPGPRRAACERSCLALHPVGFAWPPCHHDAGALLPHHFNLACARMGGRPAHPRHRRCVSVALSRGFPRVGLPTTAPCDVRTFLDGLSPPPRLPGTHEGR